MIIEKTFSYCDLLWKNHVLFKCVNCLDLCVAKFLMYIVITIIKAGKCLYECFQNEYSHMYRQKELWLEESHYIFFNVIVDANPLAWKWCYFSYFTTNSKQGLVSIKSEAAFLTHSSVSASSVCILWACSFYKSFIKKSSWCNLASAGKCFQQAFIKAVCGQNDWFDF